MKEQEQRPAADVGVEEVPVQGQASCSLPVFRHFFRKRSGVAAQ